MEHLKKFDVKNIFGTMKTINELFKQRIKIDKKYHYVIPYLIAIFSPAFNVIRFRNGDKYLYAINIYMQ